MSIEKTLNLLCNCDVDLLLRMADFIDERSEKKLLLFRPLDEQICQRNTRLLSDTFDRICSQYLRTS